MSDHEFMKYKQDFIKATQRLGWKEYQVKRDYERQDGYSTVNIWKNAGGIYLFDQSDLSEGLCEEIIRICTLEGCL